VHIFRKKSFVICFDFYLFWPTVFEKLGKTFITNKLQCDTTGNKSERQKEIQPQAAVKWCYLDDKDDLQQRWREKENTENAPRRQAAVLRFSFSLLPFHRWVLHICLCAVSKTISFLNHMVTGTNENCIYLTKGKTNRPESENKPMNNVSNCKR